MFSRAIILLSLATTVFAQSSQYEKFLVPIHLPAPAPGAFGSRWISELRILNRGPQDAIVENYGIDCGGPSLCLPEPIPPLVSAPGDRVRIPIGGPIPSVLLLAHPATAGQLVFTSRVRDASRESEGWGTWLPVVPESGQFHGRLYLLDIPVDDRYRLTLRVYSMDLALGRSVRVRVHLARDFEGAIPPEPDALLGETTLPLHYESDVKPLYAELNELPLAAAGTPSSIWLTVEPDGPFGIWAMLSITNNATQEVTMILPHGVR